MRNISHHSRLFVCCCLPLIVPAIAARTESVEVSLTQGLVPICDMLGTTPIPSWLVLSITGAERIGTAGFRIDLGVFEARELKPVDASFEAAFSCDNGYLDIGIVRTGIGPSPSVLHLSFAVFLTGDRSAACGFGEISFLSADLFDLDGHTITDVTLIPGSWYISGCDIWGYIMVRVIDGESSNPVSGTKVTLLGFVGGPGISSPGIGLSPITDATGLAYVVYPPDPSYLPRRPPQPVRAHNTAPLSHSKFAPLAPPPLPGSLPQPPPPSVLPLSSPPQSRPTPANPLALPGTIPSLPFGSSADAHTDSFPKPSLSRAPKQRDPECV